MNYVITVLQNASFLDLLPWGVGATIFGLVIAFLMIAGHRITPFGSTYPIAAKTTFAEQWFTRQRGNSAEPSGFARRY